MDELLMNGPLTYKGKKLAEQQEPDGARPLLPYLPGQDLVEAVNLSIYLQRPLLIEGEPGCGKTRLAGAVARELDLPFDPWFIKSTSKARDGFYTYDTVGRLRDAQLASINHAASLHNPASYVKFGPFGRAFQNVKRTVVLVDEIDKADIDFPNDLLLELDEQRFFIEETGQQIQAKAPPIVFITSNDEKALPDAFLRRCLFHYIIFPDDQRLVEIVNAHFPAASDDLVKEAVARFMELRATLEKEKGGAGKNVSTSELIDWFRVLQRYPKDKILAKLKVQLPYPSVLLKSWDDHRRFLKEQRQLKTSKV